MMFRMFFLTIMRTDHIDNSADYSDYNVTLHLASPKYGLRDVSSAGLAVVQVGNLSRFQKSLCWHHTLIWISKYTTQQTQKSASHVQSTLKFKTLQELYKSIWTEDFQQQQQQQPPPPPPPPQPTNRFPSPLVSNPTKPKPKSRRGSLGGLMIQIGRNATLVQQMATRHTANALVFAKNNGRTWGKQWEVWSS